MTIFIKLQSDTRKRLNKLLAKYKRDNPEIKNSITQDWIISKALKQLEGRIN